MPPTGAKSRYITTISHELRTPLNSILGYAQLLEEDDAMPAHRRRRCSVIRRGGDHLLSLIEGTLDIARIESGKLTLDVRPMRFADGMAEIVRLFELQAAERGIALSLHDATGTLPAVVRADEKRLRQILINLLGNAVKFTARGQVTLRVTHQREMARFEIERHRPGHDRRRARRGVRALRARLGRQRHVGRQHRPGPDHRPHADRADGRRDDRQASQPGVGTTFTIRLFLPELQGAAPARAGGRVARTGYLGPRRRMLVVDNEEADRRLLLDVLRRWASTCADRGVGRRGAGPAGCARMRCRPTRMFMDLAMPGIDGWDHAAPLRAAGS
jgi:CheY-like chemotaxis protein